MSKTLCLGMECWKNKINYEYNIKILRFKKKTTTQKHAIKGTFHILIKSISVAEVKVNV